MIATAEPDLAAKFASGDPDGVRAVYHSSHQVVLTGVAQPAH